MELKSIEEARSGTGYTALLYCPPGVGKSTAIGIIAEASEGNTLVLDIDRTISTTLAKHEVVKNTDKIKIVQVENRGKYGDVSVGTFKAWSDIITKELTPDFLKENDIRTVAVDNISELERCILSDLGIQGKNNGVPAMGDYQYMQFNLVNSLRQMKSWGVNILWTAWEDVRNITATDGTMYSQIIPKMSLKIIDNICGLCDVVGRIGINEDGEHGIYLQPQSNFKYYAKNQLDARGACKIESFINWEV